MNILFVCTGNTCRSPMAERMLTHLASTENLNLSVLSAGLRAFPTAPVSFESVVAVQKIIPSLDISDHRAHTLDEFYMSSADEVIAMTEDLKRKIQQVYPAYAEKVTTLAEITDIPGDVQDPYGYGQATYDACGKQIYSLLQKALPRWEK